MTLVPVQILRALAAAMVVWHHARHEAGRLAGPSAGLPGAPALDPGTLLPWWAGVDLFFVISGFVIVLAGAPLLGAAGGRGRFLARRAARVAPLYWLATGLYLALALARPGLLGEAGALAREPGYVLASFLFWPAARPDGSVQPLYGLGWTLQYEASFYALFALAMGASARGTVLRLALGLAALVAAGALASTAAPAIPAPLRFWSDPIALEFALGAGLGLLRGAGARLAAPARLGLAALGLLGLALAGRWLPPGEAAGFARPLLVGLPAALLVAAAALGPGRDRAATARLPAPVRWLSRLGDASYALYLVHPFALRLAREGLLRSGLAPALDGGTGPWGGMLAMLAASLAAALLVHRAVEAPLTRVARRLLGARRPGRSAPADGPEAPRPENRVRPEAAPVPPGRGAH